MECSPNKRFKKEENNLCNQYEEKVRPCIDLIDSLRALGVEKDLALPAIAVIGDQSSGKSSVLEALSGVALPRGSGIVTRCPLELKMKNINKNNNKEWKGKIVYLETEVELKDSSEVEAAVRRAQNAIAGEGLDISDELITLEISSPDVPDLTLIDLPGITRVAVGNQPKDIGKQIMKLIQSYITKQETINLVVVPSNVDIATTEALKMAQTVDPEGERTLGILTKPDLIDEGTENETVDVVRNQRVPLKKGYMIVKCRGQSDLTNKLSLEDAIKKEKEFFEEHTFFSHLLEEGRATIPLLAEKLTQELTEHIQRSLPTLENQIETSLQKMNKRLHKYGEGVPESLEKKKYFFVEKIKAFNEDLLKILHGEEDSKCSNNSRTITHIRKAFNGWQDTVDKKTKAIAINDARAVESSNNCAADIQCRLPAATHPLAPPGIHSQTCLPDDSSRPGETASHLRSANHGSAEQQDKPPPCRRCGNMHTGRKCRFRNVDCYTCGRTGHISAVCYSNPSRRRPQSSPEQHTACNLSTRPADCFNTNPDPERFDKEEKVSLATRVNTIEIWDSEYIPRGRELPGFVNFKIFENSVRWQIKQLEDPAIEVLKEVAELVGKEFVKLAVQHFSSFCALCRVAQNNIEHLKLAQEEKAKDMIFNQFKLESVVYCQDTVYSKDFQTVRATKITPSFTFNDPTEKCSVEEMIYHITAYYKSVKIRLGAQIPMIIQLYLFRDFAERLQNAMMQVLQSGDELEVLFHEGKDVVNIRNSLKERIRRLHKARLLLKTFFI
ncbi:interferon-induced GTP-binding protein Mx2-like isoform X1 [Erythrolamprus reginae]|uniref:interferon-induced GTP-binding protein Mx2-like isoform X1 n=1 Tax=Erythrolamprus reginae TaxID=121349 RepID=UPI00396CCFCC